MDPLHFKAIADQDYNVQTNAARFYQQNGCELLHVLKRIVRFRRQTTQKLSRKHSKLRSIKT